MDNLIVCVLSSGGGRGGESFAVQKGFDSRGRGGGRGD